HEYLYRERTRDDDGLVEIWHPWESGMDNSPLWDEALARISPTREAMPDYERVDLDFVDAAQRPTDAEYDRYAYLVKLFRDWRYDSTRIREESPFVVHDVLFNSLLVQGNRELGGGEQPNTATATMTRAPPSGSTPRPRRHTPRSSRASRRCSGHAGLWRAPGRRRSRSPEAGGVCGAGA